MSATVSAFGHRGTTSSVKTEIVRELVNASDGAGLHFDGSAGGINLGTSMPDLGTKYSLEFVVKGDSKTGETYLLDAYKSGARIIFGWSGYSNGNIQLHINGTWSSAFMATPDNGQVVHLVLSVDGTSATLYQNGNSVSTQTVVANTMTSATSTHIGCSQNGTANYFNGTIYRARFYNRTLSADDVRTAYQRADVPVADQYGSQGSPYTSDFSSGTDSFSSYGGAAVAHSGSQINITSFGATGRGIYRSLTFSEPNKKYRVKLTGSVAAGTKNIGVGIASAGADDAANRITLTTTPTTHTIAVTYPSGSQINVASQDAVDTTVSITSLVIEQIGCVSDYDFAFANPTQSLTVQDRSTNNVDGTANSSTAVTQVQPIIQGNMRSLAVTTTSQAAGVPADGDIIVSGGVGVGAAAGAGGHGLTVDKSVADDWVAKIKNSGNTTPYGLQVDCQGSNAVTAFAVYAGSAPNNTSFTIKPSGAVISGPQLEITDSLSGAHTTLKLKNTSATASIGSQIQLHDHDSYFYQTIVDGDLRFYNGAEKMIIKADGKVAIGGITSPDGTLHVHTASAGTVTADTDRDDVVIENSANVGMTFLSPNTNKQEIAFGDPENSRMGLITYNHDDDSLAFKVNNVADRLKISSTGLATFSGGIALQTAPTNEDETASEAYTLDKYETGTWTCTLGGVTGGNTTAYYTRVGDIVTVWFYSGSMSSDGSAASISGLPFTVSGAAYGGFFAFHNTYVPTANSGYFSVGNTSGYFTAANTTSAALSANATGRYLMFTGVYKAA